MRPGPVTLRLGDRTVIAEILPETPAGRVDDGTRAPEGARPARVRIDDTVLEIAADGQRLRVEGDPGGPAWVVADGDNRWVYHDGCVYQVEVQPQGQRRRPRPHGSLSAPMPATVRQIRVAVGDAVAQGAILIVLEAMKMELPVRADADGTVAALHCREGELVQPGRPLIDLTPREGA